MNQRMKIYVVVAAAVLIAASSLSVNYYLHKGGNLAPVYNVKIMESNGTVETFNLSSVGGYAYIPSSQNGTWYLDKPLSRIVTLIPSVTATLYALHAYKYVVGVDQYSVYPTPTKNVSVLNIEIGSLPVESITNLTPDAIITTTGGFTTQQINQVVNVLHIPYLVLDPGSIPQIESQNNILGYFTGTSGNAGVINGWMNSNLNNLSKDLSNITSASEKSVFYDLGAGSGGLYTAGTGTFVNDELKVSHLNNIVNMSGYPVVSSSFVINSTPDYVLLDQYVNQSSLNQSLPGLNATKNGDVVAVANDSFFTEPNFRIIYSVYWLAEQFYPNNVNLSNVTDFNNYTHLNLLQNPESGVSS